MDARLTQRYDVATRSMLNRVFGRAWEQLRARHPLAADPAHVPEARSELAKRIAEAYENGERNPQTLEFVALKAFDRSIKKD